MKYHAKLLKYCMKATFSGVNKTKQIKEKPSARPHKIRPSDYLKLSSSFFGLSYISLPPPASQQTQM